MTHLPSKDLKKFLLASAIAVGFALTAGPSQAGTVDLSAVVAVDCSVTIADENLVLDIVAGATDQKIAEITEDCNETAGFTITISSANAGNLEGTGALENNNNASIDYTVTYHTESNADLATNLTLSRNDAEFDDEHALYATVAASSTRLAGSYEDTITVSIAAQ